MSTFGGKFKDIPGISVDKFDHNNLDSEVYFLSHCHVDHMVGINTPEFQGTLKERNCFIYVSHVTKAILKQLHPNIESQIRELDFHTPTSIYLKRGVVSVIPIPSGHCPGSVMFLFELDNAINILYTGDYRVKLSEFEKIRALYNSYGKLKNIHKVYLDTTFFFESYLQFPTRKESLDEICNIIKDWLIKSDKHIVNIATSARYGYEYVFMEIYKRFNIPIHVNKEAFAFYSLIPDMDKAVSLDSSETRIHSSCGSNFRNICIVNKGKYSIKTIKISALRWKTKDLKKGITSANEFGTNFVCYSTHASYQEGIELIRFLKPQKIQPCVLRFDVSLDSEIFSTIEKLLSSESGSESEKSKIFNIDKIGNDYMKQEQNVYFESGSKPKKIKLFNTDKIGNDHVKQPQQKVDFKNYNDTLLESALDSPPRTDIPD